MKSEVRSQAFLRKRKMLLVLPLLVIPFLTMAFWAMGGGEGSETSETTTVKPGLNLNLPNANIKEDKQEDKLSFYDKAEKDSLQKEEWMRNDPYYKDGAEQNWDELEDLAETTANKYNQRLNTTPYEGTGNNPEEKIMQRLTMLEREMNKTTSEEAQEPQEIQNYNSPKDDGFSQQVDRLEGMLEMMNKSGEEDPEISQLDGTLDKILDIQHPDRVKLRVKEKSVNNKEQVFPVTRLRSIVPVSLIGQTDTSRTTGFYGANSNGEDKAIDDNAIEAVVHETQTLVNGSVVKLRLLNDIYINGAFIPKDNFVFGMAFLNGERLEIEIKTIRYQQSLFAVKLQVYDIDGIAGIHIPGAISRDVAKQSADNSLQLMELSSMDPSFKAQATAAGIGAAKGLLSKKVKLIRVAVKAGYKVLLKDGNDIQ